MKKRMTILTILILMLMSSSAFASDISIKVDGKSIHMFEDTGIAFVDLNGRTMVPLRLITEKIGHTVKWQDETKTIIIDNNIKLKIGDKNITVGNINKQMDTVPIIKDGKTFVPLRFVSESLGYDIKFEPRFVGMNPVHSLTDKGWSVSYEPKYSGYILEILGAKLVDYDDSDNYIHLGYLDFERDLKDDRALENYLKDKNGDSYSLERFYLEAGGKGPTAPIFFIHTTLDDGTKAWELIIRQSNGYIDQLEPLLKNIAGNEAGEAINNYLIKGYEPNGLTKYGLKTDQWIKMSDKIEFYYDRASGSSTFYIRNIQ